jgi:L-aspartate oxidase
VERFDSLVIGAGVAGLRAAIELGAAGQRVLVITKDAPEESSSAWARGGIAVALSGEEEDLHLHEEDTIAAGAGLCEPNAVRILVHEGRDEVLRLIGWGARFDRHNDTFHLTREAAHSSARILHAGGDATGQEIVRTLLMQVRQQRNVQRWPSAMAAALWLEAGVCVGAQVLRADRLCAVRADAVILATGGFGRVYGVTSNPPEATGDGIALALAAGAVVEDMEFVQFHPTALAVEGMPPVLLTEALRGEGALIKNTAGERFLFRDDPRGELAPRDVVARGIAREVQRQGGRPVLLDLAPLGAERLRERFPSVWIACETAQLTIPRDPVPIQTAAHYAMGGIATDLDGRVEGLPGLWAAGENASVGVHGANRLASNSLLEGLVFGARAARSAIRARRLEDRELAGGTGGGWLVADPRLVQAIRSIADRDLGIVRDELGLHRAIEAIRASFDRLDRSSSATPTREQLTSASLLVTARAIAHAALWREESRGAHFRSDFVERDDRHFRLHSRQRIDGRVSGGSVDTREHP